MIDLLVRRSRIDAQASGEDIDWVASNWDWIMPVAW
jgi:hypothetical protein